MIIFKVPFLACWWKCLPGADEKRKCRKMSSLQCTQWIQILHRTWLEPPSTPVVPQILESIRPSYKLKSFSHCPLNFSLECNLQEMGEAWLSCPPQCPKTWAHRRHSINVCWVNVLPGTGTHGIPGQGWHSQSLGMGRGDGAPPKKPPLFFTIRVYLTLRSSIPDPRWHPGWLRMAGLLHTQCPRPPGSSSTHKRVKGLWLKSR